MPRRCAISSAESPEPSRNAFNRWPISSKRGGISDPPRRNSRGGFRGFQALGGVEGGIDDALIAGAAAEIARDGDAHLLLGRIGIVAQKLEQRRQHARRAEAALQAVIVAERFLERMKLGGRRRDAFDGQDLVAVRLHREHQARARGEAVEQDRAGAADAVLAAEMGAGEAELLAHEIGEREADLDLLVVALAVDGDGDVAGFPHARPPTRLCAAISARRDITVARCWRYDAGACTSASASSLRHSSQASLQTSSEAVWPTRDFSTSRIRTGIFATPPMVSDTRLILPFASSSRRAAAEAMAKSPWRRANSTKPWPWPLGQDGKRTSTRISSGSIADVM